MRTRIIALLIGVLLLLVGAAAVPAASGSVPMSGQVVAAQGGQQVQITASATDGSGWRLQAVLVPLGFEPGSTRNNLVLDMQGQYALTSPGTSPLNGQATAKVNGSGVGSLALQDPAGGAGLQASFSSNDSGAVSMTLTGQFPAPLASSGSGATTSTTPAQPVNHDWWFLSRAAGFTAYLLLFVNVVLGLGMSTKSSDGFMARWRVFDLHQFTGLLAVAVLGLHIFSLLGDKFFSFGFVQLLVPFAAPYRPGWTALGVIGFYSLLVVTASFYVRKYIGYRMWRTIHYVTFATFFIALGHGVLAGTDTSQPWARLVYVSTGLVVAGFTAYRFMGVRRAAKTAAKRAGAATRTAKVEAD